MARICCLNNYSIQNMWQLAESSLVPRQHLWGIDAFASAGHTVELAPFHEENERNLLDRLSNRSKHALGHLDQEAYALRRIARVDVLYSADEAGLAGLAFARKVLPRTRLLAVVHHPLSHPLRRAAAARHDALVCLSAKLRADLERDLPAGGPELLHLPWGPDLDSPLYRSSGEGNGVVSAGKSNRDLRSLAGALERTGATGLVYDLARQLPKTSSGPVRVVHPGETDGVDPNSRGGFLARGVIADIAGAAIVAIPVREPGRLTGLTEAADAIALAKPIIATRSPYFPFDIEEVGCGIWVEPGDAEGWTDAIARLLADPAGRLEMGAAGRRFAEQQWNYDRFCAGLLELIER